MGSRGVVCVGGEAGFFHDDGLDSLGGSGLLSDELACLGGHSLLAGGSSSPPVWERTLELRGEPAGAFFVCCSNLPIRFATLWRGRSSGRGLDTNG